jgi:hypothetical protein
MDVVVRNPLTLREGVSQSRAVLFLLIYPSRRTRGSSSQHSSLSLSLDGRRPRAKGKEGERARRPPPLFSLHFTPPGHPHRTHLQTGAVQRSAAQEWSCYAMAACYCHPFSSLSLHSTRRKNVLMVNSLLFFSSSDFFVSSIRP